MPKIRIGNKEATIPFDPLKLATLIYHGFQVYPDDDADTESIEREGILINKHLEKLWKDQGIKTIPKQTEPRRLFGSPERPRSMPDSGFTRKQGIELPETTFEDVVPNPFNKYDILNIERPNPPTLQEALTEHKKLLSGLGIYEIFNA